MNKISLAQYISKIPKIKELKLLSQEFSLPIFLVGGFLRDICFDLPFRKFDFDFCLEHSAEKIAKIFAKRINGTFVELDKENNIYRVVLKSRDKLINYDFSAFKGKNLVEDLQLRDLTINSLAVDITARKKELVDHTNALEDISSKMIRAYRLDNFLDDPLRILRAFSFSAIFNLAIEERTYNYIKENYQQLKSVAAERISEELFKILSAENSYGVFCSMDKIGIISLLFPESDLCREMEQGDYHHLDVWKHSMESLRQSEILISSLISNSESAEYLNTEISQGRKRYQLIKLAVLLHDIGKPSCRGHNGERITFYTHEKAGANLVESIAKRLKLSSKEEAFIKTNVMGHMRPGALADEINPSEKAIYKFMRDLGEEAGSVIITALSDWNATCGIKIDKTKRESHIKIMLGIYNLFLEKRKEKPIKLLLNGNQIMKILKIQPSKRLGEIVSALHEHQHLKKITTKEQAINWLKEQGKD